MVEHWALPADREELLHNECLIPLIARHFAGLLSKAGLAKGSLPNCGGFIGRIVIVIYLDPVYLLWFSLGLYLEWIEIIRNQAR